MEEATKLCQQSKNLFKTPVDSNPKSAFGMLKAPLHLVPPVAVICEAGVFRLGAKKYGPYNWREKTVAASVYYAAAMRHLMSWWDGENIDPESGESHLAHARACLAIVLDAESLGRIIDDRPPAGTSGQVIRDRQLPMQSSGS